MIWSSSSPHSFALAPVVIHLLRLYFVLGTVLTAGFIRWISKICNSTLQFGLYTKGVLQEHGQEGSGGVPKEGGIEDYCGVNTITRLLPMSNESL